MQPELDAVAEVCESVGVKNSDPAGTNCQEHADRIAYPNPKARTMTTLPVAARQAQVDALPPLPAVEGGPVCPADFERLYPGAERIDLDGYCVWAIYLGRQDGVAISEPVLTDADAFDFAHGVPPTPDNLRAIAEHDETHIEETAMESARESFWAGLRP